MSLYFPLQVVSGTQLEYALKYQGCLTDSISEDEVLYVQTYEEYCDGGL